MDPRLPWKITLVLCSIVTIIQLIVLILLMLSFVKEGAVFKKIVRIDNRFDNAVLCEPLPLDQRRVCGILKSNQPVPDGWRMMTVDDVTKYKEECSGVIGRGQTVALHDGKFEGENAGF